MVWRRTINYNIIDYISRELTIFWKANNIEYLFTMITNATLINDDIIDKICNQWKIKKIQISLDGDKDEYLFRKGISDNLFEKVLCNITKLSERGIYVTIRLNYDAENYNSMRILIRQLGSMYKKKHVFC